MQVAEDLRPVLRKSNEESGNPPDPPDAWRPTPITLFILCKSIFEFC
jgi:hypothetical protein